MELRVQAPAWRERSEGPRACCDLDLGGQARESGGQQAGPGLWVRSLGRFAGELEGAGLGRGTQQTPASLFSK